MDEIIISTQPLVSGEAPLMLPPPRVEVTMKSRARRRGSFLLPATKAVTAAFAAVIYLAAFALGLLSLIETGIDSIFLAEVFSGNVITASSVSGGHLSAPTGDGNAAPSDDPGPLAGRDEIMLHIKDVDHSARTIHDIYNETSYAPDEETLLEAGTVFPSQSDTAAIYGEGAPLVLVIHTHGTEAYAEDGVTSYSANESFRTKDTARNVVAVGDRFCEVLRDCGIVSIHCREMFDSESYEHSYEYSSAAVRAYLAEYPSIRYVFDIHRDALISQEGEYLAPTANVNSVETAQIMLVVGTDHAGAYHPTWQKNLAFALRLQENMLSRYPSLARGYNLRSASFNQQLSSGFLLVEIGSCANTLDEAKQAAYLFAMNLAEVIGGDMTS